MSAEQNSSPPFTSDLARERCRDQYGYLEGPYLLFCYDPQKSFRFEENKQIVATIHRNPDDDVVSDFFVRACNNHYALIAAVEALLPYAAVKLQGTTDGQPLLDNARAALAKARGAV